MIEIDGSYGSGGGAILRISAALSAVTGKPIHVFNIRKNRPKGSGLKIQHLEGLKAVAELCDGKLEGAKLNSEEIWFYPGKIQSKNIDIKIGTAGSIGLIFQSLKLPSCYADGDVNIKINGGATFGKYAPPTPYTQNVLLSTLRKTGYNGDINIIRHGFFPVGGAEVNFSIKPCKTFKPIILTERGKIKNIEGISIASKFLEKPKVAERQAKAASDMLKAKGFDSEIKTEYAESSCPGSGIVLFTKASTGTLLGSDSLGERGKPAETVGKEASESLLKTLTSNSSVDEHLSDQLLVFMALAKGKSIITAPRLTNHAKTNMWVIKKFLDVDFNVKEQEKNVRIECSGLL